MSEDEREITGAVAESSRRRSSTGNVVAGTVVATSGTSQRWSKVEEGRSGGGASWKAATGQSRSLCNGNEGMEMVKLRRAYGEDNEALEMLAKL